MKTKPLHICLAIGVVASALALYFHAKSSERDKNDAEIGRLETKIEKLECELIRIDGDKKSIKIEIQGILDDAKINYDDAPIVQKERMDQVRDLKADFRTLESLERETKRDIEKLNDKINDLKR